MTTEMLEQHPGLSFSGRPTHMSEERGQTSADRPGGLSHNYCPSE